MQKTISLRKHTYTLFVIGLLALRLFFWFAPGYEANLTMAYLWPTAIAAFLLVLRQNSRSLSGGLWISSAFVLWLMLTNVINGDHSLTYNGRFLVGILISVGLCYPVALRASGRALDRGFSLLAGAYVLLLCALALVCLYAALTNQLLSTPLSDRFLGIQYNRLYVFAYHPNEVACAFSIALFLSVFEALRSGPAVRRVLYGLAFILLYAAISITLTRTVLVTVSLGCGLCAFLLALAHLPLRKAVLRMVAGLGIALLSTALVFWGFTPMMRCISAYAQRSAQSTAAEQGASGNQDATTAETATEAKPEKGLLSTADADQQTGRLVGRDLVADLGTLTGRTDIWKAGLRYIQARPITLLIGATDAEVSRIPGRLLGLDVYHMHNLWLEILLLGGVPGLLLYLLLMFIVLKNAFYLLTAAATPPRLKFLAAAAMLLMVNGVTEIYPGASGNIMDMMFFAMVGAVVSYANTFKADPVALAR